MKTKELHGAGHVKKRIQKRPHTDNEGGGDEDEFFDLREAENGSDLGGYESDKATKAKTKVSVQHRL